jgi:Dolichyl-phosphate-mannose-protein mannosyltransferase
MARQSKHEGAMDITIRGSRRRQIIILILMGAVVAILGMAQLHKGEELAPYDTAAYLATARDIRAHGGPPALIVRHFTGEYTQANRMPLYLALLSILPYDSVVVLGWAKALTLVLGIAVVVGFFILGRKAFGPISAILGATLLAVNSALLFHSTIVACETLFAFWIGLSWILTAAYLRNGRGLPWLGAVIALAYLTKTNGLFMAPIAALAVLHRERFLFWKKKSLWVGVGIFILLISPLLIRNIRVYGSPSHSINTAVMWQDSWEEHFTPNAEHSMRSYRESHTLADAAKRVVRGGKQQAVYSLVAVGETIPLKQWLGFKVWPVGLLLHILALVPLFRKQDRMGAALGWLTYGGFNLFFAWYPVKDIRFVLPLIPIILILAARGIHLLVRYMNRIRPSLRISPWRCAYFASMIILCVTILGGLTDKAIYQSPLRSYKTPPGYDKLHTWLQANCREDATIMMGPSHDYAYFWGRPFAGRIVAVPSVASMAALLAYAKQEGIRTIVVDRSIVKQREAAFRGHFAEKDGLIQIENIPNNWGLAFQATPSAACVIQRQIRPNSLSPKE